MPPPIGGGIAWRPWCWGRPVGFYRESSAGEGPKSACSALQDVVHLQTLLEYFDLTAGVEAPR
jgi:hypothetical protein